MGLLDAAAQRPRASVLGEDACPTLALKAAALLHSVAGDLALVDGDKRLAWFTAVVFLDLDGHRSGLGDGEAFELVMEVAATDRGVPEIAARLAVRAVDAPPPPSGPTSADAAREPLSDFELDRASRQGYRPVASPRRTPRRSTPSWSGPTRRPSVRAAGDEHEAREQVDADRRAAPRGHE